MILYQGRSFKGYRGMGSLNEGVRSCFLQFQECEKTGEFSLGKKQDLTLLVAAMTLLVAARNKI